MSAEVRPAVSTDIDAICHLLHTKMNPKIPLARWYNLMNYRWTDEIPDYGRVVDYEGQVLGYCGMVYADRTIDRPHTEKRNERVVSMTSWYLDKSLRGKGLGAAMLIDCTSNTEMTYATLTNSAKPLHIQEKIGFRVLEDHRFLWHKIKTPDPALTIVSETSEIIKKATEDQRRILKDMAEQPLKPLMFETDSMRSLLLLSIKRKHQEITWFDVMYASNFEHFTAYAQLLADALLEETQSVLASDGRFVVGKSSTAKKESLPVPRFYYSSRMEPHEVDNLYSELQLLDLKLD